MMGLTLCSVAVLSRAGLDLKLLGQRPLGSGLTGSVPSVFPSPRAGILALKGCSAEAKQAMQAFSSWRGTSCGNLATGRTSNMPPVQAPATLTLSLLRSRLLSPSKLIIPPAPEPPLWGCTIGQVGLVCVSEHSQRSRLLLVRCLSIRPQRPPLPSPSHSDLGAGCLCISQPRFFPIVSGLALM